MVKFSTQRFPDSLFPEGYALVPGIREVYELHLAWLEAEVLSREQLVDQSAYFCAINGQPTRHFLTCVGDTLKLPEYSSSRLKSFFVTNSFRTGYATHGLFPYRGKFHPQMVRGILNAIGVGPGKTVLDPMMGSGTVPIEACLLGSRAIGIDISPFCVFMTETKASGLTMPLRRTEGALANVKVTFDYFARRYGVAEQVGRGNGAVDDEVREVMEEGEDYVISGRRFRDRDTAKTYGLLLLAFLDAMGYAQRSQRKQPVELFKGILERYLHCCRKFQDVRSSQGFGLGEVEALAGDARSLDIPDESIDAILFSPPYSFAVDYAENDAFHLAALGVQRLDLDKNMIGLRGGRKLSDKYACYIDDMHRVLRECLRVLRRGCYCVIVIGTNSNQLGKALNIPIGQVTGLDRILRTDAESVGFSCCLEIPRAIKGMANTMREEHILFLRRD